MTPTDFYRQLQDADAGTIEIDGTVLIFKSNHKWHLCHKSAKEPQYFCGANSPFDPTGGTSIHSQQHYENKFDTVAKTTSPRGFLEQEQICRNCQRKFEPRFNLRRVVFAVPTDAPGDGQ